MPSSSDTGITGGWAAKELTEKGLRVLMLERGRMVQHGTRQVEGTRDSQLSKDVPEQPSLSDLYKRDYFVQSKSWAFNETTRHLWNNDRLNPYVHDPEQFNWLRADVVGGRSLLWSGQVYRWSDLDFEANLSDGHGIDWPIRYRDIASWYDYVERFIGVSGQAEGLPHLPDGAFQPPMKLNAVERHIKRAVESHYARRRVTIGRAAVLTMPMGGRGACTYCGPCQHGCSVGALFSTQSSTLPAAVKTGNLTLRADSVVERIDYDPETRLATGVRVVDANTHERISFTAKVIFLCASTIGTNQILLNSRSASFPRGLANSSGKLGKFLIDHTSGDGAWGIMPGFRDEFHLPNRPNGFYVPRFRNLAGKDEGADFFRGYAYQGLALRMNLKGVLSILSRKHDGLADGSRKPGPWIVSLTGFGECLPYESNRVYLRPDKLDRFGIPQVAVDFHFRENEDRLRDDQVKHAVEMLKVTGVSTVRPMRSLNVGGDSVHEMGGARMGRNSAESVVNEWNQTHDVPNLFVTDGACMTSASCVNPSLTYMALTARAADFAVARLREGTLAKA